MQKDPVGTFFAVIDKAFQFALNLPWLLLGAFLFVAGSIVAREFRSALRPIIGDVVG